MNKNDNIHIYKMTDKAFRFFTNRRHDKKLIIDIQNMLQTLTTTTTTKKKNTKHDMAGTPDMINFLKAFMSEL